MLPVEYFYAIKAKHKITSDYKLAEFLKLNRARISAYVKGKEWPNPYACMRIANALNLDPLEVLSDIESQSEKDEEKKEFWRDFLWRVKKRNGLLVLALSFTACLLVGGMGAQEAAKGALVVFMLTSVFRIMYIMLN
ncbi:MAG: helix-turn-helix transcriptional regulator [Sulfuricellaceae bacterium]